MPKTESNLGEHRDLYMSDRELVLHGAKNLFALEKYSAQLLNEAHAEAMRDFLPESMGVSAIRKVGINLPVLTAELQGLGFDVSIVRSEKISGVYVAKKGEIKVRDVKLSFNHPELMIKVVGKFDKSMVTKDVQKGVEKILKTGLEKRLERYRDPEFYPSVDLAQTDDRLVALARLWGVEKEQSDVLEQYAFQAERGTLAAYRDMYNASIFVKPGESFGPATWHHDMNVQSYKERWNKIKTILESVRLKKGTSSLVKEATDMLEISVRYALNELRNPSEDVPDLYKERYPQFLKIAEEFLAYCADIKEEQKRSGSTGLN